MPCGVLGRPDLLAGVFAIGILPRVGDVHGVLDRAGAYVLAEKTPDDFVIDWQRPLRQDGIPQLLELFQDVVVESGIVLVGPRQYHDPDTVLGFELAQNFPALLAKDRLPEMLHRLHGFLRSALIFFRRKTEYLAEGVEHLPLEKSRRAAVDERVQKFHPHLLEKIALLG